MSLNEHLISRLCTETCITFNDIKVKFTVKLLCVRVSLNPGGKVALTVALRVALRVAWQYYTHTV